MAAVKMLTVHGSGTTRTIQTGMGALQGIRKEARYHKHFYAYYGIPYAKPPVGELRFKVNQRTARGRAVQISIKILQ